MSTSENKVKVRLRKWMPVAVWRFGAPGAIDRIETCPICQNAIAIRCIECQCDEKRKCGISYGICGHMFHVCCIGDWIEQAKKTEIAANCCMCNQPWELSKEEMDHC